MTKIVTFILIVLFATPCIARADGLGMGLSADQYKDYGFYIGDYNLFDQKIQQLGVYRYGGGGGRFDVGTNGVGINAIGNSGVQVIGLQPDNTNALSPFIGVEPLNGAAQFNTGYYNQDFYQGLSGLSTGIDIDVMGLRALLVARGGVSYGTLGHYGLAPDLKLYQGAGAHFNLKYVDLSLGTAVIRQDRYLQDINIITNIDESKKIGVKVEDFYGIRRETNGILFIKGWY